MSAAGLGRPAGRLFTSFDEAWLAFLDRREPLESFRAAFPEEACFLLGWLLPLDASLLPAVRRVRAALSRLPWITPQPDHFLHTWLAAVSVARRRPTAREVAAAEERARRAWSGTGAFEVRYRRLSCFHSAVVVEVEGDGPRRLLAALLEGAAADPRPETFLPHLTIGTVREPHDPAPLREALVPLREAELGGQLVSEASLCVVPASRETVLGPWEAVGSVALAGARPQGRR